MVAVMAVVVNLDYIMSQRGVSLSELSERVGITLANLSILKTGKAKLSASRRLRRFVGLWIASRVIFLRSTLADRAGCVPGVEIY